MSEFDSNTADVSAMLDADMYLDYQSDPDITQENNLNEILEEIENEYKDDECYKILKKACEENPSLGEYTLVSQSHYEHVHSKVLTEIYMWHTEEPVLKDGEITDRDLWMNLQICRKQPRHILITWQIHMDMTARGTL